MSRVSNDFAYRARRYGRLVFDTRKIAVFVVVNLQGGQELGVVVLHRETEARTVVGLQHLAVVALTFVGGARDTAGAVVVRGDRERPVAQFFVVRAQQSCGGHRFANRIKPFIAIATYLQIFLAGCASELPYAKRAGS